MKRFKLKFDLKYHILIYAGTALCVVLLGLNVFRLIKNGDFGDAYPTITYLLTFLIAFLAPALLLSVLYSSFYIVENGKFVTRFGWIKSSYSVSDFTELVYNEKKKELNILMGEQYMVFKVDESWVKELVNALKAENRRLIYNETEDRPPVAPSDDSKKEK